jgi:hypothetical protein
MPTGQNYATNVPQAVLTGAINASVTSFGVNSLTGWPATPFTATLDIGTSSQEPIDVLTVSGNTITSCVRAIDSTSGFSHTIGATLTHGDIGRDFREARAHIDASTSNDSTGHSVHGLAVSSSVVGTTDPQTLTNKTLVTPAISSPSFSGNATLGSGSFTGTGGVAEATLSFSGLTGASSSTTRYAGTTAGGPPTSGTFITGDVVYDTTFLGQWLCTSGGTPGTWVPMGRMLLATNTPTTGAATFSSIPQGFTHLEIEYVSRTSNAGGVGVDFLMCSFNGVVTATYNQEFVTLSNGGAVTANSATAGTSIISGLAWSSHIATVGSGRGTIKLPFYNDATYIKNLNWQAGASDGGTTGFTANGSGSSSAATAVSSITITPSSGNFLAGSTFKLYGLP